MYIHVRGQCLCCHSFDIHTQRWGGGECYLIHIWYKQAYTYINNIVQTSPLSPIQLQTDAIFSQTEQVYSLS